MKKLALYLLFIFGALFIPVISTLLISGNMGVADRKMGITVEMKNGEKMDGEQFVIGMDCFRVILHKRGGSIESVDDCLQNNFVKAASGENAAKMHQLHRMKVM